MKYQGYYKSPVGILKIDSEDKYITGLVFEKEIQEELLNDEIIKCKKQLDEYFRKERKEFELNLKFTTGTEFQNKVWEALKTIPYGETATYKDIAERVNSPKACRAVGGANNKNPIAIIVPCHRVIGANGKLVGFGGGIENKEYLLRLEDN